MTSHFEQSESARLFFAPLLTRRLFVVSTYRRVSAETSPSTFPGRSPSRCDSSAAPLRPSRPTGDPRMFPSAFWETVACFQCLARSPPACSNLWGHKNPPWVYSRTWHYKLVQSISHDPDVTFCCNIQPLCSSLESRLTQGFIFLLQLGAFVLFKMIFILNIITDLILSSQTEI